MRREISVIMERQGLDPALVYAFNQTGLIVTEDSYNKLSSNNLKKWNKAIDAYQTKQPKKNKCETIFEALYEEIPSCLIAFGYFLEKEINKSKPKTSSKPYDYIYFCAVKTFKTFKSIMYLLKEDVGDDVLLLSRSMYENYLHIIYVKETPDYIQNLYAQAGIKQGTHEYLKTSNGKEDRSIIVDRKTLKQYKLVGNFKMVSSSPYNEDKQLFDDIYSYLSSYIHPNLHTKINYLEQNKYTYHLSSDFHESVQNVIFLALLILDQLSSLDGITPQIRDDLRTIILRVQDKLLKLLSAKPARSSKLAKLLIKRAKLLGKDI